MRGRGLRSTLRMRGVHWFMSTLLLHGSAAATSIVVQLDSNRILFAADTHGDKLDPGSKSSNETECKIVSLGNAAFAVTGNMDYVRNNLSDPVASWDSRSDASEAYSTKGKDLAAAVREWASRARNHYSTFYLTAPSRVKQLAGANAENILLRGMFAGFQGGKAILIIDDVYLDEHQLLQPVFDKQIVLSARELPYSSNAVTQELIEGHSDRKAIADMVWFEKSKSISLSDRPLRRIEFLIQETAKYDQAVGTRVNILEIVPQERPARWLQSLTCSTVSDGQPDDRTPAKTKRGPKMH